MNIDTVIVIDRDYQPPVLTLDEMEFCPCCGEEYPEVLRKEEEHDE